MHMSKRKERRNEWVNLNSRNVLTHCRLCNKRVIEQGEYVRRR